MSFNVTGGASSTFELMVAAGKVPGWEVFRKFGMNDGVPASGSEEMWPLGTVRVLPSAAAVVSVVSDDAADDVASTGTQTVTIEGLDSNYDEISETIDMDGLTPSTTTATFLRVNRMYGATAGTGQINAGNITASISGDAQAYIEAGEGQTHQTHYTVPNNHSFIITNYVVSVGRMSGSSDIHIQGEIMLDGSNHWRAISDIYLYNGGAIHANDASVTVVPAKTEIRQLITSTSTTQAYGIVSGYLVDTAYL